jgi:hypothetical protein
MSHQASEKVILQEPILEAIASAVAVLVLAVAK